ncbi:MAG: hypothetical protein WC631_00040 [Candidatus Paceibacterota bacterium]|jgi:hypothetical protein
MEKQEKFVVMDSGAWTWYNNHVVLDEGKRTRPRNMLPLSALAEVTMALGRPLTQSDLSVLVGKDGSKAKCGICGEEFQPVRFAIIDDDALMLISESKAVLEDMFLYGGSFMEHQERIYPLCGGLWLFDPTRKDSHGEWYSLNPQTCLGQKLDEFGRDKSGAIRPTLTLADVEEIREKEREARAKKTTKIEGGTVIELVGDCGGMVKFVQGGVVKGNESCTIYLGTRRHLTFDQNGIRFAEKVKERHPKGISRGMNIVYERNRVGDKSEAFGWAPAHEYDEVLKKYQQAFSKSEPKPQVVVAA